MMVMDVSFAVVVPSRRRDFSAALRHDKEWLYCDLKFALAAKQRAAM